MIAFRIRCLDRVLAMTNSILIVGFIIYNWGMIRTSHSGQTMLSQSLSLSTCWLAIAVILSTAVPARSEIKVDFKRDIRPILSNRCFACHGPDEGHIESGLQLHSLEFATRPADSGKIAIQPGKVSESELIQRIVSEDESERMPPPHMGQPLTPSEIEKMKSWIEAGAVYSKHWSYDPIAVVDWNSVPIHPEWKDWNSNPIDRLLGMTLKQKGWAPSPTADLRVVARRVSLDLTGLPPAVADLQRLLADTDEHAYERWVDELLASPAFGEHWARKWLDMIQKEPFGDTVIG
jgi:hypothetical protein